MDVTLFCYGCDVSEIHTESVWEIKKQTFTGLFLTSKITSELVLTLIKPSEMSLKIFRMAAKIALIITSYLFLD